MTKRLLISLMAALALFAIPSAAQAGSQRPTHPLSGIDAGAGECDVEEHESVVETIDLDGAWPLLIALPDGGRPGGECSVDVPPRGTDRGRPQCRGPPSA